MVCEHEWVVFSTALADHALMMECAACHAFGVVKDPSREEWGEAYHAPSQPYRWEDNARVEIIRQADEVQNHYVEKDPKGNYLPAPYWRGLQETALGGGPSRN